MNQEQYSIIRRALERAGLMGESCPLVLFDGTTLDFYAESLIDELEAAARRAHNKKKAAINRQEAEQCPY